MADEYYSPDLGDVVSALEGVQDAVRDDQDRVVSALNSVRDAVQNQHTWVSSVFWVWIAWFVFSFVQDSVWESKFRYATYYDVTNEQVTLLKKPHDCEFLKAPIGSKECHFDKVVAVTKVGKDTKTGRPVVSHDDGKTWDWDDSTDTRSVPGVWVSYMKVEDE